MRNNNKYLQLVAVEFKLIIARSIFYLTSTGFNLRGCCSLHFTTTGMKRQVQQGITGMNVKTHVVPPHNVPNWRSVEQVEYGPNTDH